MSEQYYAVCSDCGAQTLIGDVHKCKDGGQYKGQRIAAELIDRLIAEFQTGPFVGRATGDTRTGAGLLWLFRIAGEV